MKANLLSRTLNSPFDNLSSLMSDMKTLRINVDRAVEFGAISPTNLQLRHFTSSQGWASSTLQKYAIHGNNPIWKLLQARQVSARIKRERIELDTFSMELKLAIASYRLKKAEADLEDIRKRHGMALQA